MYETVKSSWYQISFMNIIYKLTNQMCLFTYMSAPNMSQMCTQYLLL